MSAVRGCGYNPCGCRSSSGGLLGFVRVDFGAQIDPETAQTTPQSPLEHHVPHEHGWHAEAGLYTRDNRDPGYTRVLL